MRETRRTIEEGFPKEKTCEQKKTLMNSKAAQVQSHGRKIQGHTVSCASGGNHTYTHALKLRPEVSPTVKHSW